MKLYEILNKVDLTEMGPDMNDPNSIEEWITRYKRIIKTSSSIGEREMAAKLLSKIQTDLLHDKLYKDLTKPEPWAVKLGRGISRFINSYITETIMITELGPDLNDRQSVNEWIARYKRIIEESNGIGEREMAAKLLKQLYADLGRSPDPEPKAKAKAKTTSVSTDTFQVVFFGHYYDPMAGKRGSDKVWGWGVQGDYIFQFWGPNGKTPGVKRLPNTSENRQKLNNLAIRKERKGYNKINASDHVSWLKRVLAAKLRFDG